MGNITKQIRRALVHTINIVHAVTFFFFFLFHSKFDIGKRPSAQTLRNRTLPTCKTFYFEYRAASCRIVFTCLSNVPKNTRESGAEKQNAFAEALNVPGEPFVGVVLTRRENIVVDDRRDD